LVTILLILVLVFTVDETAITAIREIDGKETVSTLLPLIIGGQKSTASRRERFCVDKYRESQRRSKALTIVEPIDAPVNTKAVKFETGTRSAVHLISST
jgi:electron transfer flavoprotein beta subunit